MAARASMAMLQDMILHAPDPNEPLPLSNKKGTIYGTIIPFLVMSWLAVAMRMWVRCRIVRDPGWDDYLVVVAACMNSVAVACVLHVASRGLGHHYLYIGMENEINYQKYFYLANAIYVTETTVIKLSLLVQYLRIFQAGTMRMICHALLGLVILWGAAYGFIAWFPCFPVPAYWRRLEYPNATCYGFGFDYFRKQDFIALYESHTALNMIFDIAIFATPLVLFTKERLKKYSVVSMVGIFTLGIVVVFTSIWRLYSIVANRAATVPYVDFTWWAPITLILACLEINLAIICASMPVFWPQFEKSLSAIFVTHEVHITEHHRIDQYELEEGERKGSMKSDSANSRKRLTMGRTISASNSVDETLRVEKEEERLRYHYKDPYMVAQINPFPEETGGVGTVKTNVGANPDRSNWVI